MKKETNPSRSLCVTCVNRSICEMPCIVACPKYEYLFGSDKDVEPDREDVDFRV